MNPDEQPGGQQPAGQEQDFTQMPLSEYRRLMEEQPAPPSPATQSQRTLWETVKAGFASLRDEFNKPVEGGGYGRLAGAAREVGRNVTRAANQTASNIAGAVAQVPSLAKVGLDQAQGIVNPEHLQQAEAVQQNLRKAQEQDTANFEHSLDAVFGPQSNDAVARFSGAAAGFAYKMAPAVILGGESAVARVALAGPGFALASNPYEDGLAELAARAPNNGIGSAIRALGQAGSVKEIDGAGTAMLKRYTEGMLTQLAFEGIIYGAKAAWAFRNLGSKIPEEAAQAKEILSNPPKPVESGPVKVIANEDGTAHVVANNPPKPEYVKAASLTYEGKTYTGFNHNDAADKIEAALGRDVRDVNSTTGYVAGVERGFVTSEGRVIDDQAAQALSRESGQYKGTAKQKGVDSSQLEGLQSEAHVNVPGKPIPSEEIAARTEGFTYDPRTGKFPDKGFAVANPPGNKLIKGKGPITEAAVREAEAANAELLQKEGTHLGGWYDAANDTHYIEVSEVHPTQEAAEAAGRARGELAIYDLEGGKSIDLGPKLQMSEAQAQAASINYATKVMQPKSAAVEMINAHLDKLDAAIQTGDPEAVASVMAETTNYGTHSTPEDVRATIDEIAKKFQAIATKAAGRGISVDDVMKKAALLRRTHTDEELLAGLYDAAKSAEENLYLRQGGQHMLESYGQELERLGELSLHRPDDPAIEEATLVAYRNWLRTLEATTAYDTESGRAVRYAAEHTEASLLRMQGGENAAAEASQGGTSIAGMATRSPVVTAKNIQTIFRLSGGSPKNQFAAVQAAKVLVHTGKLANALQLMKSMLISGVATMKTITQSGQFFNHFNAGSKALGALFEGDMKGAQDGARLMVGLWQESREALRTALLAAERGTSVINPQPVHIAVLPMGTAEKAAVGGRSIVPGDMLKAPNGGGKAPLEASKLNQLIRIPGHINVGLDEFTRVQGYRAYVRMMGMREASDLGLKGTAFDAHVASVLDAAFDKNTGVALFPEALAWADRATFQTPLTEGSYGKALSKFINDQSALQIFVPFVRASGNGLGQAWQMTPFLYKYNPEVQIALKQGGRAAQEVRARVGAATAMVGWGLVMAASDKVTANGPKDPGAREVWLSTHQPYSINFGTVEKPEWHSYVKMGPIAHLLGVTAGGYEAWQTTKALGSKAGADDFIGQMLSSVYNNTANMAYNQGIQSAMDNLNDGSMADKAGRSAGMMFFPRIVSSFNGDPIKRDAQDFIEKVYAATPVLSDKVPPMYNWLGEYQYNAAGLSVLPPYDSKVVEFINKVGGLSNKSDISPEMPMAEDPVAQEVQRLSKGFTRPERKVAGGTIDLADSKYRNQMGQLPWDYMNRVMRDGFDGRPGLRQALSELIASEKYQNSSGGTVDFPGGARYVLVQRYVQGYREKALAETRKHFKALNDDMRAYDIAKGAAMVPEGERRDAILQLILDNQ